jgi:hypothetical protein
MPEVFAASRQHSSAAHLIHAVLHDHQAMTNINVITIISLLHALPPTCTMQCCAKSSGKAPSQESQNM